LAGDTFAPSLTRAGTAGLKGHILVGLPVAVIVLTVADFIAGFAGDTGSHLPVHAIGDAHRALTLAADPVAQAVIDLAVTIVVKSITGFETVRMNGWIGVIAVHTGTAFVGAETITVHVGISAGRGYSAHVGISPTA